MMIAPPFSGAIIFTNTPQTAFWCLRLLRKQYQILYLKINLIYFRIDLICVLGGNMRFCLLIGILAWGVWGCTVSPQQTPFSEFEAMTTPTLWAQQNTTQSLTMLALIEAELGVRGESSFGGYYLGRRSSVVLGQNVYQRETNNPSQSGHDTTGGDIYNCNDFSSSASAQKFFLSSGGPQFDQNNLDADGDGLACEWGTHIQKIAVNYVATTHRYTSYSRCYVGPRGGTYTITASGNKNYGGC